MRGAFRHFSSKRFGLVLLAALALGDIVTVEEAGLAYDAHSPKKEPCPLFVQVLVVHAVRTCARTGAGGAAAAQRSWP